MSGAFWHKFLKQKATYWALSERSLGWPPRFTFDAPQLIDVLWFPKKQRFYSQADRDSTEALEIISKGPLVPGGVIALGDHLTRDPQDVDGLHEVMEPSETDTIDRTATLHQCKLRPVWPDMPEDVKVYAMERVETARSYTMQRGGLLYDGEASVVRQNMPGDAQYAGQLTSEWDVMVTIPATDALRAAVDVEVVWSGPHGELIMDGTGGLWDGSWSPFIVGIGCKARKA